MIRLIGTTYDNRQIDYTPVLREAEWTTQRYDAPGKLTFGGVDPSGIALPEGSAVVLTENGQKVFAGYVFTVSRDRFGNVNYTAYDQLRYLKANASYTWTNATLDQIILEIAADFSLKVGNLATTGYTFPTLVKENESCLDIIFDALSTVIHQTGKIFAFYDNAGELNLREVKDLMISDMIGSGSMLTDYEYKRDIDSDTYNRIKLVRPNETTGRTDVYVHEDSDNIRKWGLLQYYDKVEKNYNEAQIDAMCQAYLKYYNRVSQSLTLEAMGIPGVRAGTILPVIIQGVEELSYNRLLLCEKVTHSWEGEYHTMNIDVKDFGQLGAENL